MPMTRLRATSGRTTVSPPTAAAVARATPGPLAGRAGAAPTPRLRSEARSALEWAASEGAVQTRAPGVGSGSGRPDLGEQRLDAVDAVLVLVQDEGQFGLGRLLGDRVDGAPAGQGGHGHLGHQRQRLVAFQGAGEQVGGLDEEGQRAAAEPFQLGEPGALHGQRDPVGGELQPQGLLVASSGRGPRRRRRASR